MADAESPNWFKQIKEDLFSIQSGIDIEKIKNGKATDAEADARNIETALQSVFEGTMGALEPRIKMVRIDPGKGPIFKVSVLKKHPSIGGAKALLGTTGKIVEFGLQESWKPFAACFPNDAGDRMETSEIDWSDMISVYDKGKSAVKTIDRIMSGTLGFRR